MRDCPSCSHQVSENAYECPSCGEPLRKPTRGFFGYLAKWSLIFFNLGMLLWFFSYAADIAEISETAVSDAERAGLGLGAGLGVVTILIIWAAGDIILGLWTLLTRPSR